MAFCLAQKKVVFVSENGAFHPDKYQKAAFKSVRKSSRLTRPLQHLVDAYHQAGYAAFSVDSIAETKDTIRIQLFQGEWYDSAFIEIDTSLISLFNQSKANRLLIDNRLHYSHYAQCTEYLLHYLENNGFPFAKVYLDSMNWNQRLLKSKLVVDKNNLILFDSIVLKGNAKLAKSYLYPYLHLKRQRVYNESIIQQIPSKIAAMSYVSEVRPSGIEFVENKSYLYLFLDKRKVNQFDGYIGIVPQDEKSGKVSFNGELNLHLKNVFSIGESMDLVWRSIERYSQFLSVHGNFPYLIYTPLGLDGQFVLDKKDTSYLNMNFLIGLLYSFRDNNYLKGYYDYTTSSVLTPSMIFVDDSLNYVDYKKSMYGLALCMKKLDHIYSPHKGYFVQLDASVGRRVIKKNSQVDDYLYEGVDWEAMRYRISADLQCFIPLHERWSFVCKLKGATLMGDDIVVNELFKIGGVNTLQGFDEESILASTYLSILTEMRFFFTKSAYINCFFNGAGYEKRLINNYLSDFPFGFGLGISLETKAGMFYLSYAMGKQLNNPLSFKSGKIHFGLALGF